MTSSSVCIPASKGGRPGCGNPTITRRPLYVRTTRRRRDSSRPDHATARREHDVAAVERAHGRGLRDAHRRRPLPDRKHKTAMAHHSRLTRLCAAAESLPAVARLHEECCGPEYTPGVPSHGPDPTPRPERSAGRSQARNSAPSRSRRLEPTAGALACAPSQRRRAPARAAAVPAPGAPRSRTAGAPHAARTTGRRSRTPSQATPSAASPGSTQSAATAAPDTSTNTNDASPISPGNDAHTRRSAQPRVRPSVRVCGQIASGRERVRRGIRAPRETR
jgi:hypothetical protein